MSFPLVVGVTPGSPADLAGIAPGDEVRSINCIVPRDVLEWRALTDEAQIELEVVRGGLERLVEIDKRDGQLLGIEVHSSVFDRVKTCDNHCAFCFIYQLPKGLRTSLYLKDDDYRLSFLYGNFTTLTRFTELDFERVLTEGLSPLNVSIHSTNPVLRASMLRNRRGATSLRWLRLLLDHGIKINGQLVICPGINDGPELDNTLAGVLDEYPELESIAVVPLGISQFNPEPTMRRHTVAEAEAVVDCVDRWQAVFQQALGHRMVFAADEYYLLADRPFPPASTYGAYSMYEDGIGMARSFEAEFLGEASAADRHTSGFFASVDAPAEGYRAARNPASDTAMHSGGCSTTGASGSVAVQLSPRSDAPVGVLTAPYGASVIAPLLARLDRADVRVIPVNNDFFGGNTAVTGLMVGADLVRTLTAEPAGHRYLLPDVCLSEGRFLDGLTVNDLPRRVEIVSTDGASLRRALEKCT
jgi:putative radical SAM enzyme (TIGR03279 family)